MSSTPNNPGNMATGDQNISGIKTILASIDYSVRQTFQLLDWAYNYRRFHRREIKIQEKEIKEARQATTSNLVGIPDDWDQTIITPKSFDPKPLGEIIIPNLNSINASLREGLFGSPPKLDQLKHLTGLETLIDGNEEQLSQAKDMKDALTMLTDLPSIAKQQTDSLEGIKGGIQDLKPSEEFLREQAMLFKRSKTGVGDATQMALPLGPLGEGESLREGIVKESIGTLLGNALSGLFKKFGTALLVPIGAWVAKVGGLGGASSVITGFLGSTAGAITGGVVGFLLATIDGIKGWFAAERWGTSRFGGVIGGIIGGTGDRGILSIFANAGKWAGIGAAAGSVLPIGGTIAGGLVGAAIGALVGSPLIGGRKIAKFTDSMGKQISKFWDWLTGWVSNTWKWAISPFTGETPTTTQYGMQASYNPSQQGMNIQQMAVESNLLNQPTPTVTKTGGLPVVIHNTTAQNNTTITSIKPSTVNPNTQKFNNLSYQ